MRVAKFNWNNNDFPNSAIKMCYSENVSVLLPHSHQKLELMYFYNTSSCFYVCSNNTLTLKTNDLVIVNPYEIHSCNDWGNNCKAICILIDLKKLNIPELEKLYFDNIISNNANIINIFENLQQILFADEINETKKACIINSFIYMLLSEISSHSSFLKSQPSKINRLNEVFNYIEENLKQNISVFDLAKIMYLSVDRFHHIFKESTGFAPTEYIIAKRIEKSCEFLKNTDMKISEIAQECNFCTSSYFSKKFKYLMKTTPNKYRNENATAFFISNK